MFRSLDLFSRERNELGRRVARIQVPDHFDGQLSWLLRRRVPPILLVGAALEPTDPFVDELFHRVDGWALRLGSRVQSRKLICDPLLRLGRLEGWGARRGGLKPALTCEDVLPLSLANRRDIGLQDRLP